MLNHALHALRLVLGDPYVGPVSRAGALAARLGYGTGEEVAEGRWRAAVELAFAPERRRRRRELEPQAHLAAMLSGRRPPLACEELALRARLDLDSGRERLAALQLTLALDAALAELPSEPGAASLEERLSQLRAAQASVSRAAGAALSATLSTQDVDAVQAALVRLEAALRARAATLLSGAKPVDPS